MPTSTKKTAVSAACKNVDPAAASEMIDTDQKPKNHRFQRIAMAAIYIRKRSLLYSTGDMSPLNLTKMNPTSRRARESSSNATAHSGNPARVAMK